MLRLTLLGPAKISLGQTEPTLPRKALALTAYVALEGCTSRAKLAQMLWDTDPEGCRSNLRQLLHHIGKTSLANYLDWDGKCIGLREGFACDVERFKQAIARQCWGEAVGQYRGDFLAGLDLGGASGLEDWLLEQQNQLAELYCRALEGRALELESQGDLVGALVDFNELLNRDELQERYHRQVMRLYAAMGQRKEALRQFERCQKVLGQELGVEPLPETTQLAEQIRLCNPALVQTPAAHSVSVLELLLQSPASPLLQSPASPLLQGLASPLLQGTASPLLQKFASPLEMVEYLEQLCSSLRQQLQAPSNDCLTPEGDIMGDIGYGDLASRHLPPAPTTNPAASSSRPNFHQSGLSRPTKTAHPTAPASYTRAA